jgi:hypothetical protein
MVAGFRRSTNELEAANRGSPYLPTLPAAIDLSRTSQPARSSANFLELTRSKLNALKGGQCRKLGQAKIQMKTKGSE